jgi:tRNA A-37 threonylcarbamoyl transferase component Bud32
VKNWLHQPSDLMVSIVSSILRAGGLRSDKVARKEVINGRYELLNAVGHGGMGTVYRALQRPIDRQVAVKLLRRSELGEDGPRAVKRFFKEARAIASLHHPHIIPLYDFGQNEASGDLYLVMELLPGAALGDVMHKSGPMPLGRAVHIMDQVLDALQEAHKNEIVHRDLKPDNIMIGRRGEAQDFVTVLDFGIARRTNVDGKQRHDSTTIEVCGTPSYMSPEQILGTVVDPRSDIYAAGVLLFEMLTGKLPFDSERTIDVYMGHLKLAPPKLADVGPPGVNVPGLQELMDRALAKAVDDRLPDARSFRRALRSIMGVGSPEGQPITGSARPVHNSQIGGFELVASVEPKRAPGVKDLLEQWSVDVGQLGGVLREKRDGSIVVSFPAQETAEAAIRAATVMKARTRAQRLATLRPLYLRVGIHREPSIAARLCDEAPRGGVVIGAGCVTTGLANSLGGARLEPAGELRVRGQRGTIKMLQVLTGR